MISALFNIESLAWCPAVGMFLIAAACFYFFFGILIYTIAAEAHNLPMPLDTSYLIGKINAVIEGILMVGGLIFFII